REIVAVVWMDSGVRPALPSSAENAMEKQPAWAAAMSSSGFVPMPFSKRVLKEYCVSLSTPLSLEMVPLPSFKPPRQTADALRFMFALCWSEREFAPTRPRLAWCLRNNYTFAAMDSYFGDTRLATVSSHLKRDNGAQ